MVPEVDHEQPTGDDTEVTSVIHFTANGWENYIEGLNNPQKLTPRLKAAIKRQLEEENNGIKKIHEFVAKQL